MVSLSEFLSNLFNPGPRGPQFQIQGEFSRRNLITPSPVPPQVIIDNRAVIFALQNQLNLATQFQRETFKTPPKRQCGGPGQFSCGRLNFTPLPKGSAFGIDPFTGQRIFVGISKRGSQATIDFFGGSQQLAFNLQKIAFGNKLKSNVQAFIADISSRIGLLRSEQTV